MAYMKNGKEYEMEIREQYNKKSERRINARKKEALKKFGNKCMRCGYDKVKEILEFHHVEHKKYTISNIWNGKKEKLEEELERCILLCPNCHKEIHYKKRRETCA